MAQRLSSACKVRPNGVDSGSYPVRFDGNSACSLYRGGNLDAALLKQKKSGAAAPFLSLILLLLEAAHRREKSACDRAYRSEVAAYAGH